MPPQDRTNFHFAGEQQALSKLLCAVLQCRLNVGDSSLPKNTVVSGHSTQSPPREGEAPAEPKSIVSVQLSLLADNRSPGIPDAEDKM
mgnify:CR=1 FL=1